MDQATLKKHFKYNKETGEFTRITRSNSSGSIDAYGYLILKFKKQQYKAHRMAWLYVYGEIPTGNIDHIDGDKTNNQISNLRCVSQADNCRNATVPPNKNTGYKGVHLDRTNGLKKKYAVTIRGKTHRFYTAEEASLFRCCTLREAGYGTRHF